MRCRTKLLFSYIFSETNYKHLTEMNSVTRSTFLLNSLTRNLICVRYNHKGALDDRRKQKEEEYFYKEQKKQIDKMKKGIEDAITFHEEQIKKHKKEIERQKEHIRDIDQNECKRAN